MAVQSDDLGSDPSVGELRDHRVERDDCRGVPHACVGQVDLHALDLHGVVVESVHEVVRRCEEQLAGDGVQPGVVVGVDDARDVHEV